MSLSAVAAPAIGTGGGAGQLTLVGSQGGGPGLHQDGSVYLMNGSDTVWREGSAESYFDVERLPNGTLLAGFMQSGYSDCGPYDSPCTHTGYRLIDPDGPRVVGEYSYPVRSTTNSEVHAATPLPDGSVVVSDMEYERIFVRDEGEIVWEWRASSFYDAPDDPTTTDWLHINDVDYIGEDRFLVSVRNANQILVVERGAGVVEVINEDRDDSDDGDCTRGSQLRDTDGDGDVRCGDPDLLSHQHNPQWLADGSVLVADSDNDRIVELARTDNGTWERVWTLYGTGNLRFDWPRDADRLPNGHTLITDTFNSRVVEVDQRGRLVWAASTLRTPYEADRLPTAEPVGAPSAVGNGTIAPTATGDIPVLTELTFIAHAAVPELPFWFGEAQLASVLLALLLAATGLVAEARGW
ncbi:MULTISPECIES: aryl-sulfate sulfotransferase [Salinibaculum]|uniref:aryl-sulfate sulfotransferase n=1 Tax=Salinibaculum TaxID=2732368 RepID=UPI0030D23197